MKTTHILTCVILSFLLLMSLSLDSKPKKKVEKGLIRIEVVSENGATISDYSLSSSKNRMVYEPDKSGIVEQFFTLGDVLKVKASGYKSEMVEITSLQSKKLRIIIKQMNKYEDEDHQIYTVYGGEISEHRSVGAVSTVSGEDLEIYPSTYLPDALSGRLNGYFYRKTSSEPGSNSNNSFVRASNGGAPVIMVDGVVRDLDYVDPETVESVQLLKDASLKSLYGGVYTNGILMVKTRRGKPYENKFKINAQTSIESPTANPQFLNSKDYVTAYNTALENIGLQAIYDLSNYDGSKPYQYPDVDWYNNMLKNYMNMTKVNAQFSGGTINTRYFLHLGYQGEKGLEKHTDYPTKENTISVRGNVDNTIFDFITFNLGINAALKIKKWANTSASDYFTLLSNIRPNEFPMTMPSSILGGESNEDILGGIETRRNNPLGAISRNGHVNREFTYLQSDFTMKMDFGKWIKGLAWNNSVTFDIYNYYSSRKDGGFSVYEPTSFDDDGNILTVRKWGYDPVVTSLVQGDVVGRRNWHFRSVLDYDRDLGNNHKISAIMMYFMQQQNYNSEIHSVRRVNIGAMANYSYQDKYILEASANYVGVPSFAKKNRFGLFPTIGAAWIASSENFMRGMKWLDYLKVRASYGILGSTNYSSTGIVSNYYYKSLYSIGSSYAQFTSFNNIVTISQIGNKDVKFQKSHELNAGLDFEILRHSLTGSFGIFRNELKGSIANSGDVTPGVSGKGSALMYDNVKAYRSEGLDAELHYKKQIGDFSFNIGGNLAYGKSKTTKELQVPYPDDMAGLLKVTNDGDVKGYQVIGTYSSQEDIESSPLQTFEGKVYPGDFKYKDVNGDNVINAEDQTVIANVTPKLQYGISISLKYKGINLDLLGYGLADYDLMLTNSYYQIYGGRKYTNVIFKGLPNGNAHPVLRAENNFNNFVDSDYWVVNGGFFKLRNMELGYTLPSKWSESFGVHKLKIFFRGANLFTISKIEDLDPECLSAGLTDYPLVKTFTGGLSLSF